MKRPLGSNLLWLLTALLLCVAGVSSSYAGHEQTNDAKQAQNKPERLECFREIGFGGFIQRHEFRVLVKHPLLSVTGK